MLDSSKMDLGEKSPEDAYSRACLEFSRVNIEEQCFKSGATYLGERPEGPCLSLLYLKQECLIYWPRGEVISANQEFKLSYLDKVIILDYLIQARGTPLTGQAVTYAQLPSGGFYFRAVEQRTIPLLLKSFGNKPEHFLKAGEFFGAIRNSHGDVGITIQAFPWVPLYMAMWLGDDEFPANMRIFYDASIKDYLDTYDVAMLTVSIVGKMIKFKQD
ncbi:MAG: DUF3786 domain-containing protein [Candidatus Tectomicrobia bacterium]|uniref:DUF3786 domain-containing protein n=1 Tax=Tectimicrobiota bacterium TaxID=2528274 RepID=A0A933GNC0_UNCTE|nr:DUF3786 domain-containing protein [Candidatus Tectomicrobia bacterium]